MEMQSYLDAVDVERALEFLNSDTGRIAAGSTLFVLALAAFRLFRRVGFRGELGLLLLVPGVNLLVFVALAFLPWPLTRETRQLRKMRRAADRAGVRAMRDVA